MLALPVEESRAQRQQRLQARFRDRGGIFVPSEKNSLVDILLARSVTGESPSKCATRTKPGFSPVCEKGESRDGEASADGVQDATALEVAPLVDVKAKRVAKGPRKTAKKLKGKAAKEDHVESLENELPLPGPSRLGAPDNEVVAPKAARQGEAKTKANVPAAPMDDGSKRKARLPKAKFQPPKDIQGVDESDDDDDHRKDESLRPTPKPRGRPPKAKQPSQQFKADVLDDTTRIQEAPTKPKKVVKKRRRAADSDQEDGGISSDYMAPRKRPKANKAAPAKSAATTTRKRKAVQVTQQVDSDSSAIVVVVKKKTIKVGSTHKSVDSIKQPVSMADHDDEDKYPLRLKSKARRGAKPQTPERSLYVDDDEDSEATQVDRHFRKGASVKAKSSRVGSGPQVASRSQNRVRPIKPSGRRPADSDDEENPLDVPPKRNTKARTLPSASLSKIKTKTAAKSSSKRPHDSVDVEGTESDPEELAPPPVRKRAKVVPPASDDETLVETARSRVNSSLPEVGKDLPPKITLKENTITHKSTSQRTKRVQPKSSQVTTRKGPPQEILNRIKTRPPPSSPQAGSDTDPIDFLS